MEERIREQRTYEFVYLISGKLTFEEAETYRATLQETVSGAGGSVKSSPMEPVSTTTTDKEVGSEDDENRSEPAEGAPGLRFRHLSYPILHQTTAYTGRILFTGEPEVPLALREKIQHDTQLLRYLLTKKEAPRMRPQKPSSLKTTRTAQTSSEGAPRPDESEEKSAATPDREPTPAPEAPIDVVELDKKLDEIVG